MTIGAVLLARLALAPLTMQSPASEPNVVSIELLLKALRARDSETRKTAVVALTGVRPVRRDVLEALVDVLSDTDDEVRTATQRGLEELSSTAGFSRLAAGLGRKPRPVRLPVPKYPQEAFMAKVQGTVRVEFRIGRDGAVTNARVLESVRGLDEAALKAVRTWVFAPAVQDGKTVAAIAQAPVNFRMK